MKTEITEGDLRQSTGLDYWRKRYERHHVYTPGTSNKRGGEQDDEYKQKTDFIIPRLDIMDNEHVIDFGCGIGRYAPFFKPSHYLGIDPVTKAVSLARAKNPEYNFEVDEGNSGIKSELIICFTVLQHIMNPDETIKRFDCRRLALYENTSVNYPNKNYIWFRQSEEYIKMVEDNLCMELVDMDHHYVKTVNNMGYPSEERHTLFIFERL